MSTFIIPTTKPEFERKLETFVNDYKKFTLSQNKDGISVLLSPLIYWRVLRRRRTEEERRNTQFDSHYQEWEYIKNIAEADAIKLTCDPFRGLVLELTEKEAGLWVVVHPEDNRQSKTVWEDGVYRHKGYDETIPVDLDAHAALSDWLKSLQQHEATAQDGESEDRKLTQEDMPGKYKDIRERRLKVLRKKKEGAYNQEIANEVHTSIDTVKNDLQELRKAQLLTQ